MKTAKALFISSLLALMLAFTACGDASAPAAETTLTVSTYFYDEQINFAAKRFQETHEGVTVEVIPFIDIDGQWREPEEYSQMINAAIMSGGGEDIIDVSQVTWEKLADKNKLVDLNQYLKLNPEELRMNILDAFLYNGKRFAVPLSFHFEAYRFNQAYRDDSSPEDLNLLKLTALATGHGGSKLIESGGGFNESILAEIMFDLDYQTYVDLPAKTANVDNEKLITTLESIKELQEGGLLEPGDAQDVVMMQFFVYSPVTCNEGTLDYSDFFMLVNDAGKGTFTRGGPLPAVNINSENQALAAEFISFLLSEEVQSSPENPFAPVNIKAGAKAAEAIYDGIAANGDKVEGFDLDGNIELFNEMAEKLTSVGCGDTFIGSFAFEEFQRYFEDQQTAEQTAANLQSRLTMYLNE